MKIPHKEVDKLTIKLVLYVLGYYADHRVTDQITRLVTDPDYAQRIIGEVTRKEIGLK